MKLAILKACALLIGALAIAAGISGCAGEAGEPAATVTVSAPAPTVTVTPAAEDTGAGESVTHDADSALEDIDAYALCKAQTFIYHPTAEVGRTIDYASFADSVVEVGDAARWFVSIPTTDRSRDPITATFTECVVGGTMGEPEWTVFGESASQSAPYFDGGSD